MANPTPTPSPSSKPRRWLRRLGLGAGALVVLLVAVYFVATSTMFLKGVVLPRLSAALNAQVMLRGLRVQTSGSEPLVTAQEARARYSLWDILGGNLKVAEVILSSPTITLVHNADGTSNLDPITRSAKSGPKEGKPSAPDKAGKAAVQIDLSKFA